MTDLDEELDVDDAFDDLRPEADFVASRQIHTHALDGAAIEAAVDALGSTDPNIRELVTILETLRQSFGDKDELIRRLCGDLENGIALLLLELRKHPARFIARSIRTLTDEAEQQRQIHELGEIYLLLSNEATRTT